jgi:hypothetical protein
MHSNAAALPPMIGSLSENCLSRLALRGTRMIWGPQKRDDMRLAYAYLVLDREQKKRVSLV